MTQPQDKSHTDGRRAQGDRSRQRLLDVATKMFIQRGYANSAVSQIARSANVQIPTIYYHYGSKQGLLAAVIEARATWMREPVQLPPSARPESNVEAMVEHARHYFDEHLVGLRLRLILSFEDGDESGELLRLVSEGRQRTLEVLQSRFALIYAASGEAVASRIGVVLADLYLTGVQGICLEQLLQSHNAEHIDWKFAVLKDTLVREAERLRT